ncbi:MAG: DUF1016 domain-containing protein, partial [Desulfamplus sp.]|nr:DUF1016 domain-containing protein [Desulfamplus sp.]
MDLDTGFNEIKELIDKARADAFKSVNRQLIELYWRIGQYVSLKLAEANWGEN